MPRPEAWGGDLKMPSWLRRLVHRPPPPDDTPERAHEARKPADGGPTVLENSSRALSGALLDFYNEGHERNKAAPRGDKR
jgi:hypothetical protein